MSDKTEIITKEKDPFLKDAILIGLVQICNSVDVEIGITLLIGGSVITGTLISGKKYVDGVSSQIDEAGGTPIADFYREFGKIAFADSSPEDELITPEMIHLKEAKTFDGDVVHNLGLWRGKISSVDGHTIGTLEKK